MYRPSRPPPNLATSRRARGPEMGDPEMEEDALWEMVNAPLPPRRRAGRRIFCFFFPLSLGPQRGRGVVDEPVSIHTHPPLSPVSSCEWFKCAINRTTHAPSARTQVGVAHTLTPLRVPAFPIAAPLQVRGGSVG